MKYILLTFFLIFSCIIKVAAQSGTTSFDVDGIKVIFKPTEKNVINVRLYFRGGVNNYPANQAGIENLALEATTQSGTQKYNANAFKDTAGKYDIGLYGASTYDYGYIQVNCITQYFNKGWDLFTQAAITPLFDAAQVEILKSRLISGIMSAQSNPVSKLTALQMKNLYVNTPYETNPLGTEKTISAFNADDLKKYYTSLLNKNRIFIVVVGNITKEEIFQKILSSFSSIPVAPYNDREFTTPLMTDNKILTEQSDIKINYISAAMLAPDFKSLDYVPFRLAISGLGGDLYALLHSQLNISNDPTGRTISLRVPYAVMTASSDNPKEVMTAMMTILKYIQKKGYDEEWLQHLKNTYIADSYINDQSASQMTNNLGEAEILANWQYADDLPQLVNLVTVEQLNKAILYIGALRWTYLGNLSAIDGFTPPAY